MVLPSDPNSPAALFSVPPVAAFAAADGCDPGADPMGDAESAVAALLSGDTAAAAGEDPDSDQLSLLRQALSNVCHARAAPPLPTRELWLAAASEAWREAEAALTNQQGALLTALPPEGLLRPRRAVKWRAGPGRANPAGFRGEPGMSSCMRDAVQWLAACAAPELKHSAAVCEDAARHATDAYMDDLPEAYPIRVHNAKLAEATKVFRRRAAGCLKQERLRELLQACEAEWRDGRQLCGATSLTGRPCVLPPHEDRGPDAHSSGRRWQRATPCGREQELEDDGFDLAGANGFCAAVGEAPTSAFECSLSVVEATNGKERLPLEAAGEGGGGGKACAVGEVGRWWGLSELSDGVPELGIDQPGFQGSKPVLATLELQLELPREEKPNRRSSAGQRGAWGGGRFKVNDDRQFPPLRPRQTDGSAAGEKAVDDTAQEGDNEALRRQFAQLWLSAVSPDTTHGHARGASAATAGRGRRGRDDAPVPQRDDDRLTPPSGRRGGKGRHLVPCVVGIAVEYECGRGCRFLLSPELLGEAAPDGANDSWSAGRHGKPAGRGGRGGAQAAAAGHHRGRRSNAAAELLSRDLPLFLDCPFCGGDTSDEEGGRPDPLHAEAYPGTQPGSLARLARAFVRTPAAPVSLGSRPRVLLSGPMPPPADPPTLPATADAQGPPDPLPEGCAGEGGANLPPGDGPLPATGQPAVLAFSPAADIELPASKQVAISFPRYYGIPAMGAVAQRPAVQASAAGPFRAWVQGGSLLFPL
mmetsp:Transcript_2852/g.6633  ORF Transcript_2852/g.6633 Transcript_2852/m.6633 type:complete len:758 (-) Transcript_2852:557-2830(-)